MLCKLYFDKAVNIGHHSFVLKLCFNLNKIFYWDDKNCILNPYAKHNTTKYKKKYF